MSKWKEVMRIQIITGREYLYLIGGLETKIKMEKRKNNLKLVLKLDKTGVDLELLIMVG